MTQETHQALSSKKTSLKIRNLEVSLGQGEFGISQLITTHGRRVRTLPKALSMKRPQKFTTSIRSSTRVSKVSPQKVSKIKFKALLVCRHYNKMSMI